MNSLSEAPQVDTQSPQSVSTLIQQRPLRLQLPVAELEYHLLRPRRSNSPLMADAYELWRDGWQATLSELSGITSIDSDEFGRQDEIGVLAVGRSCVSVTGLRWLDLSTAMAREDSYFRSWPESAKTVLGSSRIGISSNTVVAKSWRRTLIEPRHGSTPTPIALATVALTLRRFIESSAEKFIGTARNDRSMNRIGTGIGGTKIGQVKVHNIDSDLICQTRQDAAHLGPVVEELWQRRWQ